MLEHLLKLNFKISLIFVWISGILLIFSAFLVTFDIVSRKLFSYSISGADEISGYIFGIATMLSLSFSFINRANIRVDILYGSFPDWLQILVDALSIISMTAFIGFVSWYGIIMYQDTIQYWSHSITPMRVPLAYPQFFWLFGLIFAFFTGCLLLLNLFKHVLAKNTEGAKAVFGIITTKEEVDEATMTGNSTDATKQAYLHEDKNLKN